MLALLDLLGRRWALRILWELRVQPASFQLAGLPDAFLDAGALPTLHDRYGISTDGMASRIKDWLN